MFDKVIIADMDGCYSAQGLPAFLEAEGISFKTVSCTHIPGTHCYCDPSSEIILKDILSGDAFLRFIGSGDYHYISCLLAQSIRDPFSLVLMDNHPDNQAATFGEDVLSCGGWVRTLMERNPSLEDVLSIGPEGCPRDIPEGWLDEHAGKKVYISLDKDIMSPEYASTHWSQGEYTLPSVLSMLERILTSDAEVIAVDVCGECSPEEDQNLNFEANKRITKTIINTL